MFKGQAVSATSGGFDFQHGFPVNVPYFIEEVCMGIGIPIPMGFPWNSCGVTVGMGV